MYHYFSKTTIFEKIAWGRTGRKIAWIPTFGENDGGGGQWSFPRVSFFFRHSRGIPGNPGFQRETPAWIPEQGSRMTEGEGQGRMGKDGEKDSLDSRLRRE